MKPTRRAQPYRKGRRGPSVVLQTIQRGATLHGQNPMRLKRLGQAKSARARRKMLSVQRPRLRP